MRTPEEVAEQLAKEAAQIAKPRVYLEAIQDAVETAMQAGIDIQKARSDPDATVEEVCKKREADLWEYVGGIFDIQFPQ